LTSVTAPWHTALQAWEAKPRSRRSSPAPTKPGQADAGSVRAACRAASPAGWEAEEGLLCRAERAVLRLQAHSRSLLLEVFISLLESDPGMVALCAQGLSSRTPTPAPLFVREGVAI